MDGAAYDDGHVRCDAEGVRLRWYYPWGARRIAYPSIRSFRRFDLGVLRGRWRLWGSGDLRHWYPLDLGRPHRTAGIELNLGRWVRPCCTPQDPDAVVRALTARGVREAGA